MNEYSGRGGAEEERDEIAGEFNEEVDESEGEAGNCGVEG